MPTTNEGAKDLEIAVLKASLERVEEALRWEWRMLPSEISPCESEIAARAMFVVAKESSW